MFNFVKVWVYEGKNENCYFSSQQKFALGSGLLLKNVAEYGFQVVLDKNCNFLDFSTLPRIAS